MRELSAPNAGALTRPQQAETTNNEGDDMSFIPMQREGVDNIVGHFFERTTDNIFQVSHNDLDDSFSERMKSLGYDMRVWVSSNPVNDSGWRYAKVLKTVAHIVTDENEYGDPVVEKWEIKRGSY
tara:strand:- start:309 stop:683 length:375 start_codon:yes stop_codon:yes gene_type:complete